MPTGWNADHLFGPAFCPATVGIRPLLGSFHWSAFRRSAFGHAPITKRARLRWFRAAKQKQIITDWIKQCRSLFVVVVVVVVVVVQPIDYQYVYQFCQLGGGDKRS